MIFVKPRKYSWNERFYWYFPNHISEAIRKDGWIKLGYIGEYVEWKANATEEEMHELRRYYEDPFYADGGSSRRFQASAIVANEKCAPTRGNICTICIKTIEAIRLQRLIHCNCSFSCCDIEN